MLQRYEGYAFDDDRVELQIHWTRITFVQTGARWWFSSHSFQHSNGEIYKFTDIRMQSINNVRK